jgi:hypothetical protein
MVVIKSSPENSSVRTKGSYGLSSELENYWQKPRPQNDYDTMKKSVPCMGPYDKDSKGSPIPRRRGMNDPHDFLYTRRHSSRRVNVYHLRHRARTSKKLD